MKKTLGVGYLKVLLLATVIAILIVTTGYSYVNRGEIIFIDEVENGGTEDLFQTNELDLSNSYEYKSWKNTAATEVITTTICTAPITATTTSVPTTRPRPPRR